LSDASGELLVAQLLGLPMLLRDADVAALNGPAVHSVADERKGPRIASNSLLNGGCRQFVQFLRACIEIAHECSANSIAFLNTLWPSYSFWFLMCARHEIP